MGDEVHWCNKDDASTISIGVCEEFRRSSHVTGTKVSKRDMTRRHPWESDVRVFNTWLSENRHSYSPCRKAWDPQSRICLRQGLPHGWYHLFLTYGRLNAYVSLSPLVLNKVASNQIRPGWLVIKRSHTRRRLNRESEFSASSKLLMKNTTKFPYLIRFNLAVSSNDLDTAFHEFLSLYNSL
jgi:hypothetical protein